MLPTARCLRGATFSLLTLFVMVGTLPPPRVSADDSPKSSSCVAPEYKQFDFWIGDWNAYDADNPDKVVAHLRVNAILDGCVLREEYKGTDGHEGQSFTIYDATRKVWHQTWVTNSGRLLTIEGTFQNNGMVLSGADQTADGTERRVRGVWKPEKDGVRESAVTSIDGGKTWKPWFDIIFRSTTTSAADQDSVEKQISALDTEYQAAVKKNDVATMDRLLADNFMLVTGSGKTFTKADLLEEARSGHIQYEHQEDRDQTVRVWGDTAVVTAKLWEKGTQDGKSFDYTVWFSDTYARTPTGWQYVFGQSSLPPSKAAQ
jgi:ketosteroid isomerase-like protein